MKGPMKTSAHVSPLLIFLRNKIFHLGGFLFIATITASALSPAAFADTIRIGGSGTNLGAMRLLAEAFRKSHPDDNIVVLPSLGSSGGVKALLAGAIDIALTSRPLKDAERAQGAVAIEYGRTPFVLATARKNGVAGFTTRQLSEIYAGKINKWPNGSRLRLVLRPAGDSDTVLLKSISPEMRQAVHQALSRKGMKLAVSDQDSAKAMEKIPGALGTSTLALILSEKRALKPLSLNGVRPSPKTIADGTYPYFKRLFIVTGPKKPVGLAQQFITFVRSAAGRAILTQTGHWIIQSETRF